MLILFTLPSYASDLPPCPKGTYHNCFGAKTSPTGNKYVGEFKNNKYHGNGTYTFVEGDKDKYVGEFKNGKYHGKGTYTWADGVVKSGIWADGKFTIEDFAEESFIVGKAPKEKTAKEIEEGRKTYWRRQCALQASHAKTEYIAKQLEKVCLEKHGATRSLFDW